MGEYAEMMLDGTLCEACGEFIDDGGGEGIPRYCSTACAADRGMVYTPPARRQRMPQPKRLTIVYKVAADPQQAHKPWLCPCGKRFKADGDARQHLKHAHGSLSEVGGRHG